MSENAEIERKRDRSPSYPLIPLEVALERLTAFEAHFKRSAARPSKVGDAWGVKAKAYADRTRAALRYFGLIEYQGVGKERQVVISDEGRKYLHAQQEETRREVVRAAALRPKQIAKFWDEWGEDRPGNAACLDELVFKYEYRGAGARKFLKVYDATITFAGLAESDKIPPVDDAEHEEDDDQRVTPKVGDHVQWTSGGSDQFRIPRCITWISDDGSHARVHGSLTEIKMNELTVVDPPAPPPAGLAGKAEASMPDSNDDANDINVLLTGKRLQITADVDGEGLITLKKVLDQYEEILKLMSQPIEKFKRPETDGDE